MSIAKHNNKDTATVRVKKQMRHNYMWSTRNPH